MAPPKIRPPCHVDALSFPVFGLTWYGTPSSGATSNKKNAGVSAIAYCGGGGSSKTGVFNKIMMRVTVDNVASSDDDDNASNEGGGGGSTTRSIEISTGEALCFGIHAFRPHDDALGMVRLLACVGDEVLVYGIPLFEEDVIGGGGDANDNSGQDGKKGDSNNSNNGGGAILLGKINVGKGYGANVATYTPIHKQGRLLHSVAIGCENGIVVLYHLEENATTVQFHKVAECHGHTKSICAVNFHPRGMQVLSSAKDGTARVFCTESGVELGVMTCEVHDPNGPPPPKIDANAAAGKTKDPRMMKRPPQILVRGCAYGDLEGKTIYTIASGKRGAAYLTKWRTLVPLNSAPPNTAGGGGGPASATSPTTANMSFRQEYRVQCSPVPISATALSSDGTLLALGSVEGSVLLYNLEKQSVMKQFEGHDLPVTCLAARPIPNVLMLPGELEGGVNFDAVSASADNRLGKWTLQKKSRIKPVSSRGGGSSRQMSALELYLWSIFRIPLLILLGLLIVALRDVYGICGEEVGLNALLMDMNAAGHCIYREVLWAESNRPGVQFVPE